jgi:hypothetical protein
MKTKKVVKVTTVELLNILKKIEFGTLSDLHIQTKVKMNKTNNPYFDKIIKKSNGVVFLGGNYQTRVINETGNENFTPEKNNVGDHTSPCVLHNEKLNKDYLMYETFRQRKMKSKFFFEGDPIEKRFFESFMGSFTPNKYGVQVQSVTISNIEEITIRRKRYVVENP